MINFPFEVGVLGWASTIVFWVAVVMVAAYAFRGVDYPEIHRFELQ